MTRYDYTDTFAGPGGWDIAGHAMGLNGLGLEVDSSACATRRMARLPTVEGDVRKYGPQDFPRTPGFIGSPPCQTFSRAGKGSGRGSIEGLVAAVYSMARYGASGQHLFEDEKTELVLEPLRWMLQAIDLGQAYQWIALEQVPAVLPIWEAIGNVLRENGYSVAVGLLNAEQFGVPQTRQRAILVANRTRRVSLPTPTHSQYHVRTPKRLDAGVAPWRSMADGLGWTGTDLIGFPRKYDGGSGGPVELGGKTYRRRDLRSADQPSFTVTEKARSWTRWEIEQEMENGVLPDGQQRLNNQSGTKFDLGWPMDRPSPVIAGRGLVTMPGANANRFNGSTKSRNDGVRITVEEAARLQSVPASHVFQGTKTKQFEQVGNMVPPLLAGAVIRAAS